MNEAIWKRTEWYREARFGMFIHGAVCDPGGGRMDHVNEPDDEGGI